MEVADETLLDQATAPCLNLPQRHQHRHQSPPRRPTRPTRPTPRPDERMITCNATPELRRGLSVQLACMEGTLRDAAQLIEVQQQDPWLQELWERVGRGTWGEQPLHAG